ALVAMIVIVGLLSLETRLVMTLFGGGLEGALWVETVAAVANASLLMLIVLALSTWMNNIIAAVVAFVYNGIAGVVVLLHTVLDGPQRSQKVRPRAKEPAGGSDMRDRHAQQ